MNFAHSATMIKEENNANMGYVTEGRNEERSTKLESLEN